MKTQPSSKSPDAAKPSNVVPITALIAFLILILGLCNPFPKVVKESARRAQAKQDVNHIAVAVNALHAEYGKWPINASSGSDSTSSNKKLMDILRAISPQCEELNPKKIPFFEAGNQNPDKPKGGIGPSGDLYDPWGVPYKVRIASGESEGINNPYTDAGPAKLLTNVIAWTYGKDKSQGDAKSGTRTYSDSDDVISWQ